MAIARHRHQPGQFAHMAIEFVVILQLDMLAEHAGGRIPDAADARRHPQQDRQRKAQPQADRQPPDHGTSR
jgi:hypothetical protein